MHNSGGHRLFSDACLHWEHPEAGLNSITIFVPSLSAMVQEKKPDMHTLTFNDDERSMLIEIVEAYFARLPHEIHQTDKREYRDMLEEKQSTLQRLLKRLQES